MEGINAERCAFYSTTTGVDYYYCRPDPAHIAPWKVAGSELQTLGNRCQGKRSGHDRYDDEVRSFKKRSGNRAETPIPDTSTASMGLVVSGEHYYRRPRTNGAHHGTLTRVVT